MKIRITFLSMLAVSTAWVASAQVVEYDDMYFNSKDRTVVMASKPLTIKNRASESYEVKTAINPTDSYSARNVNPEYISQSTVNPSGTSEPAPYFTPDYSPVAINQNLNSNSTAGWNNCNCGPSGFYPNYGMMPGGFGGMYGSYYPSMYGYNPYSSFGGYNGFYNSGWSSMMGMGFGMGMGNFGMGSFGMGNYYPWGSPFYNNFYGNSFYGANYYNGYGFYPNNVIMINNGGDNSNYRVAYSKRTSRSNDLNNPVSLNNRSTSPTMVTTDTQGRVRGANGRISGDNNSGSNTYYQRGWRANPDTNSSGGTSWGNSIRSGNDSGFTNRSNPGTSDSRSSFNNNSLRSGNTSGGSNFSSGGGASRSSGGSSGGSSSGGSRGRD